MANRQTTFLIKRSNVPGKVPPASGLTSGELALNTADAILYTSGSTANQILPIGWDRLSTLSGGTVNGDVTINGFVSATTYYNLPSFSGDYLPLSGGTVYGDTIFTSGLTANTIYTNYIDFNTTPTVPSPTGGTLYFDSNENALSYKPITNQNDVTVNLGQESLIRVYNDLPTTILNGQVLHITGATNGVPTVVLANASKLGVTFTESLAQSSGVATHDIPSGEYGFMTNFGIVRDLNTTAFTVGQEVFLSDTIDGALTNDPNNIAFTSRISTVGYCLESNATTGKILVAITNENPLQSLTQQEINVLLGNTISTGAYFYTGATTASTTTINVSPMRGWIVYNTGPTYATNPLVLNIYYSGGTNLPVTGLASSFDTYLLVNSGGTLYQTNTYPTPQERRQNIFLGRVVHPNKTTILNVEQSVDFDVSPYSSLRDLWVPIKIINEGVAPSPNGATLTFKTSSGTFWGNGIGFPTDELNPNAITVPGYLPASFYYTTQTGGTFTATTTTVDTTKYDVGGVAVNVPGSGNYTTQRIYMSQSGVIRLQYGQNYYSTLAKAIAAIPSETFVVNPDNSIDCTLIGLLTVKDGTGDLSNTDDAIFTFVSKFGEILGGTAGISTTTLQQAYDNSVNPEIVTNTTLGGVQFKGGTGNDNDKNIIIETNAGVETAWITASGDSRFNSVSSNTISDVTRLSFNNLHSGTTAPGQLTFNTSEGTLNLGMLGGNVTQQIGLESYYQVINTTTVTGLTNGSVIASAGVDVSTGKIVGQYMIADGTIPYFYTLGIATEDILSGGTGYVNNFGIVRDIDTTGAPYGETWLQGDVLYVSPTIPGGLTNVIPNSPNLKIQIAIVLKLGVTDGSIFVRQSLGYNLSDLHNVENSGLESNGDLLFFSGGSSSWVYGSELPGNYQINGNLTMPSGVLSATTIDAANFTTQGFQIINNPTYGYVLTSDSSGFGYWNSVQPDTNVVYISANFGSDVNGTGLINKPYQTLAKAILETSGNTNAVIVVYPGLYTESTVVIPDDIHIIGYTTDAQFTNGFSHSSSSGVSNVNIVIENINVGTFTIDSSLTSNSIISIKNCQVALDRLDSTPTVLLTVSESTVSPSTINGGTNSMNECLVVGTVTAKSGSTIIFENSKIVSTVEAEGTAVVRMLDCSLFGPTDFINGTIVDGNTPTWEVDATTNYLGGYTGNINKIQLFNDDFYVTGGTYSSGTLTLNRQNGSVTITGFTGYDTYVTGFTYNDSNTLTISQNQGQQDLNVTINTMSGLTINGNLSATTINSDSVNTTTLISTNITGDTFTITTQTQDNTLENFLVVDPDGDFYVRTYSSINYIPNLVTVALSGGSAQFTSIKAAVDSITGATSTNPYVVSVGPGLFIEDPITMKSYVDIVGESATNTIIQANDPNTSLIIGADQSMVNNVQIQGCTGTSVSAVVYSSSTTPQLNAIFYVENVRFGTNYTHVKNIGTGGGNSIIQCSNVKYGGYPFTLGFYCTNDGSGIGRMQLRNVTSTNGGVTTATGLTFAKADKSGCGFIVNGCLLTKAVGAAAGTGFWVEDGGFLRLTGINFQRWLTGIYAPQVGSAPSIDAIALNFENCTTDVNIIHSGTTGKIQGTDNFLKTLININAPIYEVNTDPREIIVAKKGGDFSSIKSAVDYLIASATTSENSRYVISVGPGLFAEDEIDLTNTPYVSIVGSNIQTTQIVPSTNTQHLIKIGINNEVSFLSLSGAPSGYAGLYVYDIGDFGQAHKVSFYDCDTNVWVESNTQDTKFYGEYLDFNGEYTYGTKVIGNNGYLALANMENYFNFPVGTGITYCNYATGSGATISAFVGDNSSNGVSGSTAFYIQDAASLNASTITIDGFTYGIRNPNIGDPIRFDVDNASIVNGEWDLYVERVGTFGTFGGSSSHEKIFTNSTDVYWSFLDIDDGELDITRKASVTFEDGTHTDFTTLIFEGSTMGLMEGGEITTVSAFTISTAAGFGYLAKTLTPNVISRIDWNNSQITLGANENKYIYINENAVLSDSGTRPDSVYNIVLGRVVTNSTTVAFIDLSPAHSDHTSNRFGNLFRNALGPIYSTGSIVTENVTPFTLDVTTGEYYYSSSMYMPTGGTAISFTQYYRDGVGGWITTATTVVNSTSYDGNGSLSALTAGYYTKHTLYVIGDSSYENYFLVLGQNEYSTLVQAEDALLPTPPTFFSDSVSQIASIYIKQGASGITEVEDIRPVIGFKAGGVNASSVHGNLLGLAADDHTQYLLVDGSRAMAGDLDLGTNNIVSAGTINGVTIESHATRHQFGGADQVGTTTPTANAIPYADVSGTLDSWVSTATTSTLGKVTISVTPVSPSNPIAVGKNDPGYTKAITGFTYGSNVLTGTSVDGSVTTTTIGLRTKAGIVAGASFAGNPKKFTVTFTTAYPNTNYSIQITGGVNRTFSYESKSTTGFVINSNANTAFVENVDWLTIATGES